MISEEERNFIIANINANINELLLKYRKNNDKMTFAIEQIASRQKAFHKLPNFAKNFDLIFPKGISIEQSSSEITAQFKASLYRINLICDLTGGFGIDSYFFAQNSARTTYVEKNEELYRIAKHNFTQLNQNNVEFIIETAEDYLNKCDKFDLIYIDPSRRVDSKKIFRLSDSEPNVLNLLPIIIEKSNILMIKASPMMDINLALRELPLINRVMVISVNNECKELLLIYDNSRSYIDIEAVELIGNYQYNFTKSKCEILLSQPLKYIYEPNAALIKSGGHDHYAKEHNLYKLNKSTHLYTSDEIMNDYFGRTFKVKAVTKYSSKAISELLPERKANVSAKNFPISTEKVKNELKIKDGGDDYIFAVTDMNNKKILIFCDKI